MWSSARLNPDGPKTYSLNAKFHTHEGEIARNKHSFPPFGVRNIVFLSHFRSTEATGLE